MTMGAGCDASRDGTPRAPEPEVQTRNERGELQFFHTIKDAIKHADTDHTVWKISFPAVTGERVRLVLRGNEWVYEDITSEVLKRFEQE